MDKNQLIISIITITLSSLSLIATIIGWTVTARRQKELLERQIAADKEKARLGFSIPRHLEAIDGIREWVSDGSKLARLGISSETEDTPRQEVIDGIRIWEEEYLTKIGEKFILVDRATPSNNSEKTLSEWVSDYYDLIPEVVRRILDGHLFDEDVKALIKKCEDIETKVILGLYEIEKSIVG